MGRGAPPGSNGTAPQPPTPHKMSLVNHAGSALVTSSVGLLPFLCVCLAISCVCLAIAYKMLKKPRSRHPPSPPLPTFHRSLTMAALQGGQVAMQRIIDSAKFRVDKAAADDAVKQMKDLLVQKPLKFSKLQRADAKLEMSGKEDEAVEMLHKAWETADKDGKQPEAHELQMLLVEMLIYKGEYPKALGCKCLQDKEILDARGPLYKAVVHIMLEEPEKAEDYYKEFQKRRSLVYDLPDKEGSLSSEAMHGFNKFDEIVKNLKKEIEQAHEAKSA